MGAQKKKNSGGKFRKRKVTFAQVSNTVLRDKQLSLRGKGLYALIQSYISFDGFDLYKWYLQTLCKEGDRAFQGAWDELKEYGVLKQYRLYNAQDRKFIYEYELLDLPDLETPSTQTVKANGDYSDKEGATNYACKPVQKQETSTPYVLYGVESVQGTNSTGYKTYQVQNVSGTKVGVYNNTDINNTDYNNIDLLSIYQEIEDMIKENIDYYVIFKDYDDIEFVDNLVKIMVDIIYAKKDVYINTNLMPYEIVKSQLMKINYMHINYVIETYKKTTTDIKNPKAYLTSSLYNSINTIHAFYENRVQHDMM